MSVALFVCLLIGLVTLRIIDVRYIRPKNHRIAMEKKMAEEDAARAALGTDSDDDVKEGYEADEDAKDKVTVGDLSKVSVVGISPASAVGAVRAAALGDAARFA